MVRSWLYSVAGLAGFVVGAYVLLTYALPVVLPFAIAMVLAELMDPLVSALTFRGRVSRGLSVALVLLLFVGLISTAVTAGVARLVVEIQAAILQLPYLYGLGMELGTRYAEQFGALHAALPESIQKMLVDNLTMIEDSLPGQLKGLVKGLGKVSSLPAFITNLLVALVATYFVSRDKRQIFDFMLQLFPVAWRPKMQKVKVEVWASAMGWAKAQLTLIVLTMVMSIIGLSLIGANYAVLLGVMVGIADVMPLLGPAAIFLPWAIFAFVFGTPAFGVKLLVLYGIVAGVRQVLEVKVVGDQIGLHPLAILLSIYLGFQMFGALGFVAGPLLAILLKAMVTSELLPIFKDPPQ